MKKVAIVFSDSVCHVDYSDSNHVIKSITDWVEVTEEEYQLLAGAYMYDPRRYGFKYDNMGLLVQESETQQETVETILKKLKTDKEKEEKQRVERLQKQEEAKKAKAEKRKLSQREKDLKQFEALKKKLELEEPELVKPVQTKRSEYREGIQEFKLNK